MKKTIFIVNSQIKNFIQSYNNQLKNVYKNIQDGDTENNYLVLLYEDLANNLKDKNKFIDDYIAFAEKYNLPYTFFPYYGVFNRVMVQISNGIPHPSFEAVMEAKDGDTLHIIHQISPGCLVLNANKLKTINFKFDQNLPTIFYLQDMVEKCYRAKLWCSNCWYLDRFESWKDLKQQTTKAEFVINMKNFQDEQKKYFEGKDYKYKEANGFVDDIRKFFKGEDFEIEKVPPPPVKVQNSDINITVPEKMVNKDTVININSLSTLVPLTTTIPDKLEENLPKSNIEKNVHDDIDLEIFTNSQKAQKILEQAQMMEKANNPT